MVSNLPQQNVLPPARVLSQPKWQNEVRPWYLVYRWLLVVMWTFIVISSIFEFGSWDPKGCRTMWLIYMTNWHLMFGLTQAILGAILVTNRWKLQTTDPDFDANRLNLGKTERAYWFFYVATTTMALAISITYWTAVHDPKINNTDPLNVMVHVLNSFLMLLDICVSTVPFRLCDFWWSPSVMSIYILFSLTYYALGGRDKLGNRFVYKILNWKTPDKTLSVCFGVLLFTIVLHCLVHYITECRDFLHRILHLEEQRLKEDNEIKV